MRTENSEREIKLTVADGFELPSLVGNATGVARAVQQSPQRLDAVYFDTPDLKLMSMGITVRRRTGETDCPLWTVKLPLNDDATLRNEVTVRGEGSEPPREISSLLCCVLAGDDVGPVVELRTSRARWLLVNPGGRPLAELADDLVSVVDGDQVRAIFRQIEVEAREADTDGLQRIARPIRKAGAKPEQVAKIRRALEAVRGGSTQPAVATVRPGDPVSAGVRAAISDLVRSMVANAPRAFLGDREGIHQMRVKQRHLRSILRAFGPIVDRDRLTPFVEELRWLGVVLGNVRDLDVFEAYLRESTHEEGAVAPLLANIEARSSMAREELREALNSDRYIGLVTTSQRLCEDEALVVANGTCQEELPPLAGRAAARLRKAARNLNVNSPESDYHEVRKLAKRARYMALTVAGFVKPKQRSILLHFAECVAPVQDVLGEHHDAIVARERLIAMAAEEFALDSAMNLRIDRLVERTAQTASKLGRRCLRLWNELDENIGGSWPRA